MSKIILRNTPGQRIAVYPVWLFAIFTAALFLTSPLTGQAFAQVSRLITAENIVEADVEDINDHALKIGNALAYCQLLVRLEMRCTKEYKAYLESLGIDFDLEVADAITWSQLFAITDEQLTHYQMRTAKFLAMVQNELNRRIEATDNETSREILIDLRTRFQQLIAATNALHRALVELNSEIEKQGLAVVLPANLRTEMMDDKGTAGRVRLYRVSDMISLFDKFADKDVVERLGKDSDIGKELTRLEAVHTALKLQEQQIPEKHDHFKFYRCSNKAVSVEKPVLLKSLFDTDFKPIQLNALTHFGTPARKNDERLLDPQAHLAWIQIDVERKEPPREVVLENQFGFVTLKTSDEPWHILVPTEKVEKDSGLSKVNHYLLYKALNVTQPFPSCNIKVEDQFTVERSLVIASVLYVGVPVAKRHGKTETEIAAEDNWLLIYKLFGKETVNEHRDISNQFGKFRNVQFRRADAFALPSKALYWQEISAEE